MKPWVSTACALTACAARLRYTKLKAIREVRAAELVISCLGAFMISLLQLNRKQVFHQAEVLRIANSPLSLYKQTKPVKLKHMAENSSISLGFECANERDNFASQVCENMKPKTL